MIHVPTNNYKIAITKLLHITRIVHYTIQIDGEYDQIKMAGDKELYKEKMCQQYQIFFYILDDIIKNYNPYNNLNINKATTIVRAFVFIAIVQVVFLTSKYITKTSQMGIHIRGLLTINIAVTPIITTINSLFFCNLFCEAINAINRIAIIKTTILNVEVSKQTPP